MAAKKTRPRRREVCEESQQFAALYLAADTAYTRNLVDMKDAPEDLGAAGSLTMADLKRSRDVTLGALLARTEKHGC